MVFYGQLIIGAPGSGKSTFCKGMQDLLSTFKRKMCVINLDPINENEMYVANIDIKTFIDYRKLMKEYKLGPNAALLETFKQFDIQKIIDILINDYKDHYLLIDCPGQTELFVNSESFKEILKKFSNNDMRLTSVNLSDCIHCVDKWSFLSNILFALNSMLFVELPTINVLSKFDMFSSYNADFNMEVFTEVLDIFKIIDFPEKTNNSNKKFIDKYTQLTFDLCNLITDYNLVTFIPLAVEDKKLMLNLLNHIDKANGFIFDDESDLSSLAFQADFDYYRYGHLKEKYDNVDDVKNDNTNLKMYKN